MSKKPTPVKPPTPPVKPVVVKPTPAVVTPPAPVWTRLDLQPNCTRLDINQFVAHSGATIKGFDANGIQIQGNTYGLGLINIVPTIGIWAEQISNDGGNTYKPTGLVLNQIHAGSNPDHTINLNLDGGIGPQELMRWLKV
jgi:hypothetical protein